MGGKRPDQYQIDAREAGATDYKDRQEDESVLAQEKQELATNDKRAKRDSKIPQRGVNPALAKHRAKQGRKRDKQ